MSANPVGRPAGSGGNPNETKAQKLGKVGGPRVVKALDALDKVSDLGPLVDAVCKENPQIDRKALTEQVTSKLVQKLQDVQKYFMTGEKRKQDFEFTGL